ncbi:hypothetical protein KIL84_010146 [Mauremys mutica]|uniref:Uncharacterized protein n=1 Tax=Mauremys mutica TaxID=74926 RepID=A0A9D3XLY7_9SAUR|nr:hypothetical protein KIL84_010146 [Mauremys mutica]
MAARERASMQEQSFLETQIALGDATHLVLTLYTPVSAKLLASISPSKRRPSLKASSLANCPGQREAKTTQLGLDTAAIEVNGKALVALSSAGPGPLSAVKTETLSPIAQRLPVSVVAHF